MTAASPRTGCEVVLTRSGAPAMLDRAVGELMHPIVGPLVESEQIYIGPSRLRERLAEAGPDPLVLLDVGLGAGSNAIAAWTASEAMPPGARRLEIVSFERDLEAIGLALSAPHAAAFGFQGGALEAGRALVERGHHATGRTGWRLVPGTLPHTLGGEPGGSADVVYWDAYSPRANPELWTVAAFEAVRRVCRANAVVYTYSAATAVRSAMLLAGLAVGVGEAMRGTRHTTMGATSSACLPRPLDRRWLQRLARSSAPFPADAPCDALARIAALRQFGQE